MKQFDELLETAARLIGPGGCPWDLQQTFFSLQTYVLEEAHELLEAVDGQNDKEITEELGDLLYTVIFYAKIAERENRFSMEAVLETIKEKLIRRHPHVFGAVKADTLEEIEKNWKVIKESEEGKSLRQSALDGIPDGLSALTKAQKMSKVFMKTGFIDESRSDSITEEELAEGLLEFVRRGQQSDLDVESTFRRALAERKKEFMMWEKENRS